MRKRLHLRLRYAGLVVLAAVAAALFIAPAAFGAAISTTDNPGFVDTNAPLPYTDQACTNGGGNNCNLYLDKRDVWLSGLPVSAALGAGSYFFAVLVPGGQPSPNDAGTIPDAINATAKNLSDDFDAYTNRSFSVDASGNLTYSGSHNKDGNALQIFPYSDTTNNGGVYILAVCKVPAAPISGAGAPGVVPSDCKYDAFKVEASQILPGASDPTITKDAVGSYTNTYAWNIGKSADKTKVEQIGGTASFKYTVHVTHDGGTIGAVNVAGTITVFNPNVGSVTADVTDQLSDGTPCSVTGGSAAALASGDNTFPYSCDLSGLPAGQLDNTATVTWGDQDISDGHLAAGSANFTFSDIQFVGTNVDDCTTVTDPTPAGGASNDNPFPTKVCVGDSGDGGAGTGTTDGFTFTYHVSYNVGTGCTSYTNTATESTDGNYSSVTVQVCGPANNSALTIGFWKNTNGNSLIQNYCAPSGKTSLAAYLSTLGGTTGPFSDAAGKSCSQLVTYVNNIIKGANSTNMNVMLKAQMLATALDVYFSDPGLGYTTTTVNKAKPPSNFLLHGSLGGFNMDMTAICPMVDNTTAGSATCTSGKPSTNAFASGAVPSAAMTVQAILTYASTTPSPFNGSTSNPIWYAGNRTKQEILKNIFDQINNNDAFGA